MSEKDKERVKAVGRLTPFHLYKLTPRTNCGECGFATCLAFATQVISGQGDLDGCRYLDQGELQPFRDQLDAQLRAGIGVKREGFEKALHYLREETEKRSLRSIAQSLGAGYSEAGGRPLLLLSYFGEQIEVTREDIRKITGEALNPWEKILIYNYTLGGAAEPSGEWVGMEALPNSVSKIKSLRAHCEGPIARAFSGKADLLRRAAAPLGRDLPLTDEKADFAGEFQILPRLSIRILWWDEDPSEGFEARAKFLFDARVLQIVDLESLLFACEQLTDRLLEGGTPQTP